MTRIAFFAHDAGDAAVRRRVRGFLEDGLDLTGFMMRRGEDAPREWTNVDLGQTRDGAYLQRGASIVSGARRAAARADLLAAADVIYARNLDMLATAFLARRIANLTTPVIYESLDVHRLLTRSDALGAAFRKLEGVLLKRTRQVIVSSPAFIANHFARHHAGGFQATLVENRMAPGAGYGPRPARPLHPSDLSTPLVIGWVGVLRCRRSLDLLIALARKFGDRLAIRMHGVPALTEIPDFHARISGSPNISFHGRYRAPEDLGTVYAGLDLVWAGDFMEAGYNSVWLLPNRLYEGGYYAVPPIAPAATETAAWIDARGVGFTPAEDLDATLPALVGRLIQDRGEIDARRNRLLDLPESTFIQTRGELRSVIDEALRRAPLRTRQPESDTP